MTVASFGFVLQLYPVFASMKKNLQPKFSYSVNLALAMCFAVYFSLTLTSVLFFGPDNIQPNVFDNFKSETDIFSKYILFTFLLVLFCNIPFAFFAGKQALVDMVLIIKNWGLAKQNVQEAQTDQSEANQLYEESLLSRGTITSA